MPPRQHAALLSLRERLTIAAGIIAAMVGSHAAVVLWMRLVSGVDPAHGLRMLIAAAGARAALPLGVAMIDRLSEGGRRSRELAFVLGYCTVSGFIGLTGYFAVHEPLDWEWVLLAVTVAGPQYVAANLMSLAIAYGVVRAIQRYRVAAQEDARRSAIEAEAVRRIREAVEQRVRPASVITSLKAVADRLNGDQAGAEKLLLRLARDQRRLLLRAVPEPSPAPSPPEPLSADRERVHRGSIAYTLPLVVYFTVGVTTDLRLIEEQANWNLVLMTFSSMVLWCAAGPFLHWITAKTVRFRFAFAVALAAFLAVAAAVGVASMSVLVVWLSTSASEFASTIDYLPLVVLRNTLAALVVSAGSFANAYAGVLLAARAAAVRVQRETVHAEARELEARFHPHFLFNALTSIAALIRTEPYAAAQMCRRFAQLVARTTACAGVQWWTVREELELINDYVSVQRTRFADRVSVETWDIQSSAERALIPRLMLQPLVENIFKHGVGESSAATRMGLSIRKQGKMLDVRVWNSTDHAVSIRHYGRGLGFVSQRVHDAGGEMVIDPHSQFLVRCSIPLLPAGERIVR